jgi:uncharacterized repeat protein (TIGR01451 family)
MTDPQIAQVKIEKKPNSMQCSTGGLWSYTFTISNVSTTTATGTMPIAFIDTMPAGATNYVSAAPPPWGCVPFGGPGQIKCLHPPGSIPAGGQLAVTVTFQISPSYKQPTLTNCSEFFVGQGAVASMQRRGAEAMDANALRSYLEVRGIATMPQATAIVLKPDDKSCVTVNIVQPVAIRSTSCASPMVPGPVAGQCVCPEGTMQRGRRCVPPIECRAPLIRNPVGTACVCPAGTVQRGRECVRPPVCNPPAKLNRRGACECPRDMIARGNTCIERERQRPDITPGDIMRVIPGSGRDRPAEPRGGGGIQGPSESPGRR